MMFFDCIAMEHNPWLVGLAVLICLGGSWVTARLFHRTTITLGVQRLGWYFLTALCSGVAIWCTHFIAMLGFDPGVPVALDPTLTVLSLVIAVLGSTAGFVLSGSPFGRAMPAIGGAVVGIAIAAMHYTGMWAYRVEGAVHWDMRYVAASLVFAVVLAGAALHIAKGPMRGAPQVMAGLFALAIAMLHFTGMAAFSVTPMVVPGDFSHPEAFYTLALSIAGLALLIASTGMVTYLIDDSARTETVEQLRSMALNDVLTGLPNRVGFAARLRSELARAGDKGDTLALLGIDLNRFKEINDTRGHATGDEVLRVLGARLRHLAEDSGGDSFARVGGDEFAALSRRSGADLTAFLDRVQQALSRPIRLEDSELVPGASIGVAIWPKDGADADRLATNADLAMYRAKSSFTDTVCFYEPAMDELVKERRQLAADLREAIARDELHIHYQVQTAVASGEVRGYEALLRWRHPERGEISPAEFIPIAEENGLILAIGEWVLRHACAEATKWEPRCKVAVNLSAMQLAQRGLAETIARVLEETGLPAKWLEIELTESAILADRGHALHQLGRIKALGIGIALDDFGTGYSSLDTLRSFAFDKIKLDRSFVGEGSPQAMAIIRAVLALGKSLNIPVLAEGIETREQLSMLGREGCDEVQGYLLGRPAPIEQIVVGGRVDLSGFDTRVVDMPLKAANA